MDKTANIHGTGGDYCTVVVPDWSADISGLIAMRVKHGANSPIGNRCSNLIEQLRNLETNIHNRDVVAKLIARQMSELSELIK